MLVAVRYVAVASYGERVLCNCKSFCAALLDDSAEPKCIFCRSQSGQLLEDGARRGAGSTLQKAELGPNKCEVHYLCQNRFTNCDNRSRRAATGILN